MLAAAIVLALAPASTGIELSWNAPADCPSEEDVRAMLAEILGTVDARESVSATVRVERRKTGDYAAELVVASEGHRSERTLTAAQCGALAEATALVIAVTVDPAQALDDAQPPVEPVEPPTIPEPEASAAVQPRTTEEDTLAEHTAPASTSARLPSERPAPRARARSRITGVHVRALGGLDYGALPSITGAIGAAVGAHGRWFRFEAIGSWAFARTAAVPSVPSASARVGLWAIAVRACGVPAWRFVELPLCGGVEGGALEGQGTGATEHAARARRPWVAASLGPALAIVPIPRIAILIGTDVVVPLWRAQFVIGDRRVHRPAPVGFRAGLGIELRFGVRP